MIVTNYVLKTNYQLPRPLKLTLVTDLHQRNPEPVLEILQSVHPDILCMAGDMFERHGIRSNNCLENKKDGNNFYRTIEDDPQLELNSSHTQKLCHLLKHQFRDFLYMLMKDRGERCSENPFRFIAQLSKLRNSLGEPVRLYMSRGNHEWWLEDRDFAALEAAGVCLLDNSEVLDEVYGIRFGGIPTRADQEWIKTFSEQAGFKIMLSHHPEYYSRYLKELNIDLVLSGHAHGGQIRLFGKGLYASGQGIFPKYHHGIYDGRLVVSSGCSNTISLPRWGNPCEVVVIELISI